MEQIFEWDEAKAKSNFRKHGILFEEAIHVFEDPWVITHKDRIEGGEIRWKTIGMVNGNLLIFVAHTIRSDEQGEYGNVYEIIRIISARRADRKERKRYEAGQVQTHRTTPHQ